MPDSSPLRSALVPLAALLLTAMTSSFTSSVYGQSDTSAKENDPLTTYQGKSRVVLVFGPNDSDAKFAKQMSELKSKAELEDRQIVVLPVPADDKAAGKSLPYLQKKYNDGNGDFSVVLIGKDGHTAFRSGDPISAETLFGKIDAMPMRKDEIKEKSAEADKTRGQSKTDEQKDN